MTSFNCAQSTHRAAAEPVCSQRWRLIRNTLSPNRNLRPPQRANLMRVGGLEVGGCGPERVWTPSIRHTPLCVD